MAVVMTAALIDAVADTLAEVKAEALLHGPGDTVVEVEAETLYKTLRKVKTKAFQRLRPTTFCKTVVDMEAETFMNTMHYSLPKHLRPKHLSTLCVIWTLRHQPTRWLTG